MSIKHGAIMGLVMAVAAMIGVVSNQSESAVAAHAVTETVAPAQRSVSVAPTESAAILPEPIQLASALTDARGEEEKGVGPNALSCSELQYGIGFTPDDGEIAAGNTVQFYHQVLGPDNTLAPVKNLRLYFVNPIDENLTDFEFRTIGNVNYPEEFPISYAYTDEGTYSIGMQVMLEGSTEWCPSDGPYIFENLITVVSAPTASWDEFDMVTDTEAVVPLNTWKPLFGFNMSYSEGDPAPRTLTHLSFEVHEDPVPSSERAYNRAAGLLAEHNFLRWALIRDFGPNGEPDRLLDWRYDEIFLEWDAHGFPYEVQDTQGNFTSNGRTYAINDNIYNLSFTYDHQQSSADPTNPTNPSNPTFPVSEWVTAAVEPGASYIVAFVTSSSWTSGQTLGYEVLERVMQPYYGPNAEIDQPYFEDDYPDERLDPAVAYSSAFSVFDLRGAEDSRTSEYHQNLWNWQSVMYTPVADFARPRWDLSSSTIDFISGEAMDLRSLFSFETWVALLGMDIHGVGKDINGNDMAQPSEVNLIFTDIGGDPFKRPGNGGFEPKEGLERMTIEGWEGTDSAGSRDYSYNGAWVYHDTNDNGVFDVPVGGNFSGGDYPMIPDYYWDGEDLPGLAEEQPIEMGAPEWEYVPFPPTGGDPWWKIRLNFDDGRRGGGGTSGLLEPSPVWFSSVSETPKPDYFVVMRVDSGYADISGQTGDGVGMDFGADTRCFIEPRRWSPKNGGRYEGGILLSNQMTGAGLMARELRQSFLNDYGIDFSDVFFWQDDPFNDLVCTTFSAPGEYAPDRELPWWPERTHRAENVKPVRFGYDVHDLVLTYSSNNRYQKMTPIMAGQSLLRYFGIMDQSINSARRTALGIWTDPPHIRFDNDGNGIITGDEYFGLQEVRFFRELVEGVNNYRHTPGVWSDTIEDLFNGIQISHLYTHYPFETVPFAMGPDAIDPVLNEPRSTVYTHPALQPTLPRYSTWPKIADLPLAGGFSCRVYLASEGERANETYIPPESSASWASYADDVYVCVLEDLTTDLPQGPVAEGESLWLISRDGARYEVESVSGNELTLKQGHGAYMGAEFTFGGQLVDLPEYPYGVTVGANNAVAQGEWLVTEASNRRGVYPRIDDWPVGLDRATLNGAAMGVRAARLLKQEVTPDSLPTAMLGVNLSGCDDSAVNNYTKISLNSLTVAFWGPEFDSSDLAKLDSSGALYTSGVALYEDSNGNGVFDGALVTAGFSVSPGADAIVALEPGSLAWETSGAEPIDLDGDYVADDLSGDGVVTDDGILSLATGQALTSVEVAQWDGLSDLAWVLRLQPASKWVIPNTDRPVSGKAAEATAKKTTGPWPAYWGEQPEQREASEAVLGEKAEKGLGTNSMGDDLFVVVRTGAAIGAFEEFRCLMPASLPSRPLLNEQTAGIEVSPGTFNVSKQATKFNPEESSVQDFYGHDMLRASVPAKIYDLTGNLISTTGEGSGVTGVPVVLPGGGPVALLGIDVSANRLENLIASGEGNQAQATETSFTPRPSDIELGELNGAGYYANNEWTEEVIGCYIIGMSKGDETESRLESYEITAVNGLTFTFRAGAPQNGSAWYLVKDPTFLEQVVVELHDRGNDGAFDPEKDLLPFDMEDPANGLFSGVSLYRDNDLHPLNTNGSFDPPVRDSSGNIEYIDLPVRLDDPPTFIGTLAGEPEYQVRFVFSSPGTDDYTGPDEAPYEDQPRLRQWVPQEFGDGINNPNFGSDFFFVIRTSREMSLGDDFNAAIVSWGPDTPSEPDPDNFSPVDVRAEEFDMFNEFPWGSRGLGFITMFQKPAPRYFWGYDQKARKTVARQEVDHSQDDLEIRNWVRSSPNVALQTLAVTSLEAPEIDFTADHTRQEINKDITFTLTTTAPVLEILWDFGDGNTSADRDPVHSYSVSGVYTVTAYVTDQYGNEIIIRKPGYITVLEAPFADFSATPIQGVITPRSGSLPGLDITFTDESVGTTAYVASSYFWSFGDGGTSTEQNPVHRYTVEGYYTVTLEVLFVHSESEDEAVRVCQKSNYIAVGPCVGCAEGEGEGENDTPVANITFTSQIRDKECLVPLTDWAPLFSMNLNYSADNPAPRVLRTLTYTVRPDQRKPKDLNYGNLSGPDVTDILEFGLFLESESREAEDNDNLDALHDYLLFTWDSYGGSIGELISSNQYTGLEYELDFIGDGTPADPQFPVVNAPSLENAKIKGYNYILAVRTSATWRSQLTMNCTVTNAEMIIPTTGVFPVDEEGDPVDSYNPNFFDGGDDNDFEPSEAYASSFTVWDRTGSISGVGDPGLYDTWNRPMFLYTPLAEYTRPRWSKPDDLLDMMAGEFLQIRRLMSTDTWVNMIGINLQSTKSIHSGDFYTMLRTDSDKDAAQLREVNVVFTDIGADPYGPPGNGGFNPNDGLKPVKDALWGSPIEPEEAFGNDVSYNGVWVWHDTNNNGVFDAPTANADGGISYNGDYPMMPSTDYRDILESNITTTEWEYIALPPGGGDPWWQISLRFYEGRRRSLADILDDDNVDGFLEKTPDNAVGSYSGSEYTDDYFVVVRTDSGFKDVSGLPGDGTGITLGADFKAFIEPRRTNPFGHGAGGIYVDSMIPPLEFTDGTMVLFWQDDENWGSEEPWWPDRTTNAATAKAVRVGLDVHDLVLTYESDSEYRSVSDLFFGGGTVTSYGCLGFTNPSDESTDFMRWMDPFGLSQSRFLNGHSPGVTVWRLYGRETFSVSGDYSVDLIYDDTQSYGQYAFETAPFDMSSLGGVDNRSPAYPTPLPLPTLPAYANWTGEIGIGELPRLSDWREENIGARLLKQKVDNDGPHTAMLGINLATSSDPLVIDGRETPTLAQLTVAFWGPDFTPDDLYPLDAEGRDYNSGVLLWEDADENGVFLSPKAIENYVDVPISSSGFDTTVAVRELRWAEEPEPIDIDGDGVADDMNGDGVVDDADRAWVLTFNPEENWELPTDDKYDIEIPVSIAIECGSFDFGGDKSAKEQASAVVSTGKALNDAAKQDDDDTDLEVANPGDDLFISVRTSDTVGRFEKFRAVIPATLPGRAESLRKAGIQFFPQVNTSPSAYMKLSADEDPVQDFYGHDMLEVNIPVRILDVNNQVQSIFIGGAAVPVLALDISTNRDDEIVAQGADGVSNDTSYTVTGAGWTPDAFVGDFLIDQHYEAYEITENTSDTLTLLSGSPRDGQWLIVSNPSFLEQIIIELYNNGDDADFNPLLDLLPLDLDQTISGVALYRDNDMDPRARNGVFDPDYDIPVTLDAAPHFIGQTGEETQVKFVFSSPGTDDLPLPVAQQARNRQWTPNTFGETADNLYYGADFYIVVRASQYMQERDDFRVGIVSWGPNTPSEPDPDTWARLSGEERNEFSLFQEFPWGDRGLGFITFFKEAPLDYYLDGYRAGQRADASGLNWLRSSTSKKRRTGVYEAIERPLQPDSVVIESVSSTQLPSQTLSGEPFSLLIRGRGFGEDPVVTMSGYTVVVTQASDDALSVELSTTAGVVPVDPVVLIIRNPETNEETSRSDLFTVVSTPLTDNPVISGVTPDAGDADVFPVIVLGKNFAALGSVEVFFDDTRMSVLAVSTDGKQITVGLPGAGLPGNGPLDVTVKNTAKNAQDTLLDAFDYVNSAYRPKLGAWLGCSGVEGGEGDVSGVSGDALVMLLLAVALFALMRRGLRKDVNEASK